MRSERSVPEKSVTRLVNPELIDLLKKTNPATILGSSIQLAFTDNYDKKRLISELIGLANDNPATMQKIIGKRAFELLMSAHLE